MLRKIFKVNWINNLPLSNLLSIESSAVAVKVMVIVAVLRAFLPIISDNFRQVMAVVAGLL
jgi:hypothetical protein